VNERLPDGPPAVRFRSDFAVLVMNALLSLIWDTLSPSSRSLARHMAQLAAAVANVAYEAGPSAFILVF
jgi:hypothetical protein